MKKKTFVILIILFIIGIFVGVFISNYQNSLKNKTNDSIRKELFKLINFDTINDYPKNPEDIIKINNSILLLIYNLDFNEDELKILVEKQRIFFSKELLAKNLIQDQMIKINEEKEKFNNAKVTLTDIKIENVIYDEESKDFCSINIFEIFQNGEKNKYTYYLINEDGFYKILAWELSEGL